MDRYSVTALDNNSELKLEFNALLAKFKRRGLVLGIIGWVFNVALPLLYLLFALVMWIWYWATKDETTITPVTLLIGVAVFAPMIIPIQQLIGVLRRFGIVTAEPNASVWLTRKLTQT